MKVLNVAFCIIVTFNLAVWVTSNPAVYKFVGFRSYIGS